MRQNTTVKSLKYKKHMKHNIKITKPENVCLLVNIHVCMHSNSVDPDHTVPTGAVCSGSTLSVEEASKIFKKKRQKQFRFICALSVNKCEFSVNTATIFMKYTSARLK